MKDVKALILNIDNKTLQRLTLKILRVTTLLSIFIMFIAALSHNLASMIIGVCGISVTIWLYRVTKRLMKYEI